MNSISNSDEIILSINDLYLNFSIYQGIVKVLDGVNIDIYKGEILGIVGETGCGKSVTFKSVLRLLEPNAIVDNGIINFNGKDLLKISENDLTQVRGNLVSMIFQEPMTALNPTMRIGDQIGEGLLKHYKDELIDDCIRFLNQENKKIYDLYKYLLIKEVETSKSLFLRIIKYIPVLNRYKQFPKKMAFQKSIDILNNVNMPSPEIMVSKFPHELSGGMRQRALIAIALACRPTLIIADEPTTAVDVTTQAKILKLLLDFNEKMKTTLIVITHNLGVISEICDRVCVMYAGQVVEIGGVIDIFMNPLHPYTKGLMGAIHLIGSKKELEEIEGNVPILLNPPSGCRFHPRCSRRMKICIEKKPELDEEIKEHLVSCWLFKKS